MTVDHSPVLYLESTREPGQAGGHWEGASEGNETLSQSTLHLLWYRGRRHGGCQGYGGHQEMESLGQVCHSG